MLWVDSSPSTEKQRLSGCLKILLYSAYKTLASAISGGWSDWESHVIEQSWGKWQQDDQVQRG